MERLLIIDGNSLANRAFYAMPVLTSPDGLPTNVLHGFLTTLFQLEKQHQPTHIAVAFDKTKATVRIAMYAEYKAQRKPTPEGLRPQFDYLKEVLRTMEIPVLELEGYEADDVIACVTRRAAREGMEVHIVTGDRDALQLVAPTVKVYLARGKSETEMYDEAKIEEKYGLTPERIVDLKGLMGDSSDNIPGVPGVGEKTALKLLHAYGTVENVLARSAEVQGAKLREALTVHAEQALLSKKLAAMIDDLPLTLELDELKQPHPSPEAVLTVFHRYGLHKISQLWRRDHKADLETPTPAPAAPASATPVAPAQTVSAPVPPGADAAVGGTPVWKNRNAPAPTRLDPSAWPDRLSAWRSAGARVYLVYRRDGQKNGRWAELGVWDGVTVYEYERPAAGASDTAERQWLDFFADPAAPKILADAKPLYSALLAEGASLRGVELDVALAAYLLDPGRGDNGVADWLRGPDAGLFGPGAGEEAWRLGQLASVYAARLEDLGLGELLRTVEQPLTPILAAMELEGIGVDRQRLEGFGAELEERLAALETEIYSLAGGPFNINSPRRLGQLLFETLGLPGKKKTKTGYATDAETLDELRGAHPIIDKILLYRQLSKLLSTYVRGLLGEMREGRVHTTFQQMATATGRLSSTEPNLQNIPIRLEEGRRLRKAFHPSGADMVLFSADYSQIELRILAHYSADPLLCESFRLGQDVHARTAAEVFQTPLSEVTPDLRRQAKAVNFGLMYGLTEFGLARDVGVSREEARLYMTQYFARYGGVKDYLDRVVEEAKKNGCVRTLLGRIRRIPELAHGNYATRQFGARVAKNTPVQGTAADIMKIAMLRTEKALAGLPAQMLLQVHDELVIQTAPAALPVVAARVREAMEGAYELIVPLVVDVKTGPNWYDMHKLEGY
ncbi:MAG: DNA polymerase I [Gracilibacteraceae bacterium]|jgi:DNA polymerase-1|nr:DNA polymerase I [Gracilibacteraceae bacterium]